MTEARDTNDDGAGGRRMDGREAGRRASNRRLVVYLLLPTIFLTVVLLGGVRVEGETRALLFVAPPLLTLILGALALALFARARLVDAGAWLSGANAPLANVAHATTLAALFFATAQAFNTALPDAGLFRWLFAFFFLWTLWQNLFSIFDARRLLRSLAALFATAFALKHLLLASLYAPEAGWLRRVAGTLVEGVTQGTLGEQPAVAPATGYVSFFTLALYLAGLALLPHSPRDARADDGARAEALLNDYARLSSGERTLARAAILHEESKRLGAGEQAGTSPTADGGDDDNDAAADADTHDRAGAKSYSQTGDG